MAKIESSESASASAGASVSAETQVKAQKEQARERRRKQIERDMHSNFNKVLDALMVDFDAGTSSMYTGTCTVHIINVNNVLPHTEYILVVLINFSLYPKFHMFIIRSHML